MTSVLLIYPYFDKKYNRSIFRFPPLGIGYVAASLRDAGYHVDIMDCTFMDRDDAMEKAVRSCPDVIGIYSMVTMREDSLRFAQHLRGSCDLLVAGGPLPSSDPAAFLPEFDIVLRGEGEHVMVDILRSYESGDDPASVPGIVYCRGNNGRTTSSENNDEIVFTGTSAMEPDLDSISFPARDLLPNDTYIEYWKKRFGYAATTVITTRGCPFACEFCSNAVFGVSYRERSPENVIDEVEQALSLGYDHIHFADDVFTLNKERIIRICTEIMKRDLCFTWECLGRVDSMDQEIASAMKSAGCNRIFFGIESGSNPVLEMMNKKITVDQALRVVNAVHSAGIMTGAFFILCYPGETDSTVLDTLRFSTSLPLDYLSFTMPYPLPGTALYERVKDRIIMEWEAPEGPASDHVLTYNADFSESKMKFAILKGQVQFGIRKRFGKLSFFVVKPFEILTDTVFRLLR
ncbi:MAG: B12-binding domain-containing radical SAM protein [ANME-2 cluster archaeon]|nr:B12-binding domain-containing radical SAM protein [ANME-2 cluster archaeon]